MALEIRLRLPRIPFINHVTILRLAAKSHRNMPWAIGSYRLVTMFHRRRAFPNRFRRDDCRP